MPTYKNISEHLEYLDGEEFPPGKEIKLKHYESTGTFGWLTEVSSEPPVSSGVFSAEIADGECELPYCLRGELSVTAVDSPANVWLADDPNPIHLQAGGSWSDKREWKRTRKVRVEGCVYITWRGDMC
jgi:hypothetical protein